MVTMETAWTMANRVFFSNSSRTGGGGGNPAIVSSYFTPRANLLISAFRLALLILDFANCPGKVLTRLFLPIERQCCN